MPCGRFFCYVDGRSHVFAPAKMDEPGSWNSVRDGAQNIPDPRSGRAQPYFGSTRNAEPGSRAHTCNDRCATCDHKSVLTTAVPSGIKQIADMGTPCIGKMHILLWKGNEMNAHSPVAVAAVQWSKLGHIDGIRPLDASDTACLTEIRDVLRKHGNLDRFGIALLHTHFPLADDEVMLEETDEEARVQTLKPVKRSELTGEEIGTIWHLTEGSAETMLRYRSFCRGFGVPRWHKIVKQRVK